MKRIAVFWGLYSGKLPYSKPGLRGKGEGELAY